MNTPADEPQNDALRGAVRKLWADPACRRLYGKGRNPGLFASKTPANRRLAQQMVRQGMIRINESGKEAVCELTPQGRDWLLQHENPWLLLEDLLTATERQHEQLEQLRQAWNEHRDALQRQGEDIRRVLSCLTGSKRADGSNVGDEIESLLRSHAQTGSPAACSLPELFHRLCLLRQDLTIGRFHDELRGLHDAGRVRFTPWTGPLYELPEPSLALLIGHEVLYYVQLCRSNAA